MYVVILQTSLLLSNTQIRDNINRLETKINEFQLSWPTETTLHNGRLYDFQRTPMDGIRALQACINHEKELYFIQKRDNIKWLVEQKQQTKDYNSTIGTSFWVNFYFHSKTNKIMGPRKQAIPLLTKFKDYLQWDMRNLVSGKNDCLVMEQMEPRRFQLARENCDEVHQVICTKQLNFRLSTNYEEQMKEAKNLAIFQMNQMKNKLTKTLKGLTDFWSVTADVKNIIVPQPSNDSQSLTADTYVHVKSNEALIVQRIGLTTNLLIEELKSEVKQSLFLARIAVIIQLLQQFTEYIDHLMSNLELLNPPDIEYTTFEVAKNNTNQDEMTYFLIYHNLTGSVINPDFWWRNLISDHEHDKISLPDFLIMVFFSPIMLIILLIALGSYCYKRTVKFTNARVGRIGLIRNLRDCSPNKLLAL